MTTPTKLAAALLVAAGLFTAGVSQNPTAGPPKPTTAAKPDAEARVREALSKTVAGLPAETTFGQLIALLHKDYGVAVRLDAAGYKRLGATDEEGNVLTQNVDQFVLGLNDKKLAFPGSIDRSLADVLVHVCFQLPGRNAYRIRDGQVVIGPAFRPGRPNDANSCGALSGLFNQDPGIDIVLATEQVLGESISLAVEAVPLKDAVRELRRLTGANVVIDPRAGDAAKAAVTGTFDDVRLHTALEILADQAELRLVYNNNVYYLTTAKNADRLCKTPLAVPAGYVTDGLNFYRNPGNLKPESATPTAGLDGVTPDQSKVRPGDPLPTPMPGAKK